MTEKSTVRKGGCGCGYVRYELQQQPLYVHCCHCTWCQRESGAAFAINALIESSAVKPTSHQPILIDTPTHSGRGQKIARCPQCQVAVWSHYSGFGQSVAFIKVGTLDEAGSLPPDVHIFTASKLAWFELPNNVAVYPAYYDKKVCWPKSSLERLSALRNK